jgi:hypothetical protein
VGWDHTAREERLAPIGEYRPEVYRITVHDAFEQYRLSMAALVIRNGMSVPEFFLYCARYVLDHHRKLKHFRAVFRKGAREITAARRAPVPAIFQEPDTERNRRRRAALAHFCEWASAELVAEIRREKGEK